MMSASADDLRISLIDNQGNEMVTGKCFKAGYPGSDVVIHDQRALGFRWYR